MGVGRLQCDVHGAVVTYVILSSDYLLCCYVVMSV